MKSIELSVPRFQALTGQEEVPLGLQSASEITLKQELEDVTGKARVYSDELIIGSMMACIIACLRT